MNDEQASDPKPPEPGLKPQDPSLKSQVSSSKSQDSEGVTVSQNASEIAGETVAVVGESTGRFPRPEIVDSSGGESTGKHAFMVGAGILISRIIGVVRQRVFLHYLGIGDASGAFTAAFRIPNFLQNVFGEGALSA